MLDLDATLRILQEVAADTSQGAMAVLDSEECRVILDEIERLKIVSGRGVALPKSLPFRGDCCEFG